MLFRSPTPQDASTTPAPGGSEGPIDPSDTYAPYDSEIYGGQGGLLHALQTQQNQYRTTPDNDGQAENPDFRQVSPRPSVPGVTSPASPEAPTFDPLDIAKSLGIGVANGLVNAVGFPADALTGFDHFPDHFVENPIRRTLGYPDLPSSEPGYVDEFRSDAFRHDLEGYTGPFYQPNSRAGRYAETIGEMAPMAALGGGSALRELPRALLKHAVAPGVAVQGLEEALPDSKMGQMLQKSYPALRRVVPPAIAVTRSLGRRIASY